jgi:hypothetical protein
MDSKGANPGCDIPMRRDKRSIRKIVTPNVASLITNSRIPLPALGRLRDLNQGGGYLDFGQSNSWGQNGLKARDQRVARTLEIQ